MLSSVVEVFKSIVMWDYYTRNSFYPRTGMYRSTYFKILWYYIKLIKVITESYVNIEVSNVLYLILE